MTVDEVIVIICDAQEMTCKDISDKTLYLDTHTQFRKIKVAETVDIRSFYITRRCPLMLWSLLHKYSILSPLRYSVPAAPYSLTPHPSPKIKISLPAERFFHDKSAALHLVKKGHALHGTQQVTNVRRFSRLPLSSETPIRSQYNPCGVCNGRNIGGTLPVMQCFCYLLSPAS